MKTKIVIISDANSCNNETSLQKKELAENLLTRAVSRVNRWIKPDVVLFIGDTVEKEENHENEYFSHIKKNLNALNAALISIPFNHNNLKNFYQVFEKPADFVDIKGCRFISFNDPKDSEFTARRTSANIEKLIACQNFSGPIITLQSFPILKSKAKDCHLKYTNAKEIISTLKASKTFLNVSSSFRNKFDLVKKDGISYLTVPMLQSSPFSFLEIDMEDDKISVTEHQLQMPKSLKLIDHHVHTQLAYCSENMDVVKSLKLANILGLSSIVFTEHSGHLYFTRNNIEKGGCYKDGISSALQEYNRLDKYISILDRADVPSASIGVEVDIDFKGNLLLRKTDKDKFNFTLGSLHCLKTILDGPSCTNDVYDEFLKQTENLLKNGIDVLAHPFRVLNRSGLTDHQILFKKVAYLLKKHSVAVEINFHTQQPPDDFIKICLNSGLKFTIGSDAHNLSEVGELWPHLHLLKRCGYNGDYSDIFSRFQKMSTVAYTH